MKIFNVSLVVSSHGQIVYQTDSEIISRILDTGTNIYCNARSLYMKRIVIVYRLKKKITEQTFTHDSYHLLPMRYQKQQHTSLCDSIYLRL